MSVKNKVGLPVPKTCLLFQAVLWLAKGELPIEPSDRIHVLGQPTLNDPSYDEAKEALLLALRSGQLPATGIFWGDDPTIDPREDTTVKINPYFWEWDRVGWKNDELRSPDWAHENARYGVIFVPTQELFKIFGDRPTGNAIPQQSQGGARRGRKPKYDWDAYFVEIAVRADLDCLPDTAAELIRDMAEWCMNEWGVNGAPGETMLKEKIGPIYRHPRKRGGR